LTAPERFVALPVQLAMLLFPAPAIKTAAAPAIFFAFPFPLTFACCIFSYNTLYTLHHNKIRNRQTPIKIF
jgi:hypothetical protein